LEVEDLDIGYGDDLAGDVDDGADIEETNPDPDALDSDDEDDEDVKLGIDKEESEGDCEADTHLILSPTDILYTSSATYIAFIFTAIERAAA
jgi:hypothetical protein